MITDEELNILIKTAMETGASDAVVISSATIVVEKELADLCNGDPRCENYNLAPSCPPHVPGPAGFRKWQKESDYSIAVKIDVPMPWISRSANGCRADKLFSNVKNGRGHNGHCF